MMYAQISIQFEVTLTVVLHCLKGAEQTKDLEQWQGHSRSDAQGREHVCANDDIWPSADVEQF